MSRRRAWFLGRSEIRPENVAVPGETLRSRRPSALRTTPSSWIRQAKPAATKLREAEVLHATGLWEARQTPWHRLSDRDQRWMGHLPLLAAFEGTLVFEGVDDLDLWQVETLVRILNEQCLESHLITARPDIARACEDVVFVLDTRYSEPVGWPELEQLAGPEELWIEADDASNVRALAQPFAMEIREVEGGWYVRADDGQELAARLLTHGYGQVRSLLVRKRSDADLLKQAWERLAR